MLGDAPGRGVALQQGPVEPGEVPEETAGREVLEEAWAGDRRRGRLGSTRYSFQSPRRFPVRRRPLEREGGRLVRRMACRRRCSSRADLQRGGVLRPRGGARPADLADRELARRAFAASARSRETPLGVA
ncbi:MAG: NUDIX domain-containing protein [Candidatus Limnocylindrales bacterium]